MNDFGFDPYANLPDDPEAAFLRLEAYFRSVCEADLQQAQSNDTRTDVIHVNYIAQVLGAINALGLEDNFKSEVPLIQDVDFNTYLNFNKDVTHYTTTLKVRRSQREQGYSVRFDETARTKIHHHLTQVHDIFQKLEVEDKKREKLISRLDELLAEVNQPRTGFDRFAALTMEVSGTMADAVERSRVLEILDAVGRVFWGAQTEKQKQLPAPKQTRRIEPPRPKIDTKGRTEMDDDIPF